MEKKKIILVFLLALLLRIGFILTLDNTVDVWGDWWDELGWKIATGQGFWVNNPYFSYGPKFYSWRAPGFPFFLAGIYKISGHSYFAAKIGLAVLNALSCFFLFLLASEVLKSKIAGFWCALIYTFYPPSIFWTGYLVPVTLEAFLFLLVSLSLIKGRVGKKIFPFIIGGLFTGIGILIRSIFLVFMPAVFLWLILTDRKHLFVKFFSYGISVFITISPWIIRNYIIHKAFVLASTEGGIVCYIANNEKSIYQPSGYWDPTGNYEESVIQKIKGLSEVETDRLFYREAFRFIRTHPDIYWKLVKDRFFRFWRLTPHTFSGPGESYKSYHTKIALITNLPIFILAGFGFLFSLRRWNDFLLFYLLIIFWSFPIILFFKTIIRYREPLMPCIILFMVSFINEFLTGRRN
ncbi:MAG: glycosyltransferase family 39 protein [Candidatus Omnitrophica bacterium]|nr:glycosyltransferase family 39 protein [Candidatus Omnitrophota bacterium]